MVASRSRSCFWNCRGLIAVITLKWWKPEETVAGAPVSIVTNFSELHHPKFGEKPSPEVGG
jgi:hypothetical protein